MKSLRCSLAALAVLHALRCVPHGAVATAAAPAPLTLDASGSSLTESPPARAGVIAETRRLAGVIPSLVLRSGMELIDQLQADVGEHCTVERLSNASGAVDPTALKIVCAADAFFDPGRYEFIGHTRSGWTRAAQTLGQIVGAFESTHVLVRGLSDRVPIDPRLPIYLQADGSQEFRPCYEVQQTLGLSHEGDRFDVAAAAQEPPDGPLHRAANTWLSWCRAGAVAAGMRAVGSPMQSVQYTILGMGDAWQRANPDRCRGGERCDASRRVEVFVRFVPRSSAVPTCDGSGALAPGPVPVLRCYERVVGDSRNVLRPSRAMTGQLPLLGGVTPPESVLRVVNGPAQGISSALYELLMR